MSTSAGGTGIGINITPVPLSLVERTENAEEQNARNALALIANPLDTVNVSFVEHRDYKYNNHYNRPALGAPTQQLRVLVETSEPSIDPWQHKYEELFDQLPPDIKSWMQEQSKSSFYLRDLEYFAMHSLMASVAAGLVWYANALQPLAPHKLENANRNLNLPFMAAKATLSQGREVVQSALTLWAGIGRNDPNYDKNVYYLNEINTLFQKLEEAAASPNAANELKELSKSVEQLKAEYQNTDAGPSLRIIGQTINTLSLALTGLLAGYGPASALWSLSLGTVNLPTGALTSLVAKLTEGLNLNIAEKKVFEEFMTTWLTLSLATTMGIAENGLLYMPKLDKESDKALRSMALVLTAKFLVHANILPNLLGSFSKTQELIKEGGALSNLVLMIMALEGKEGLSVTLFNNLNSELLPMVDKINAGLEGAADPALTPLKIYLQQAKIALENNDYSGFSAAYHSLLDTLNISSKQLQSEFEDINQLGRVVKNAVLQGPEDSTNRVTAMQAA